jgi:hypothetical protein
MSADFEITPKPFDENHPELFDTKPPKARLRSSVSAICSQRFIVQARPDFTSAKNIIDKIPLSESLKIPNRWIPLGTYDGGDFIELPVWSVRTIYRITGEHYYNATWRSSSAELWSYSDGTLLAIYFEDDTPGDRDYNDLIIQIDFADNFKEHTGLVPVEHPTYPPPPQPLPPGGGKPYPIKPTHPH